MAYEKLKTENYSQLGGINAKASPYDTGTLEFTDISNMDFFIPGTLRQRSGTATFVTGYSLLYKVGGVTQLPTGPVNGVYEFQKLNGNSFIIFCSQSQSSLGFGQTLSSLWAIENQVVQSVTLPLGISGSIGVSAITSFISFGNALFMCDGNQFFKWDGVSGFIGNYGLPLPSLATNFTFTQLATHAEFYYPAITLTISYSWVDTLGFIGPAATFAAIGSTYFGVTSVFLPVPYATLLTFFDTSIGSTQQELGFIVPPGFNIGLTSLSDYNSNNPGNSLATVGVTGGGVAIFIDQGVGTQRQFYQFLAGYSAAIMTPNDMTLGNYYVVSDITISGGFPNVYIPPSYALALQEVFEPTCINATLAPQFLEVYNNQLFSAGFSQAPSTVQFSDIGEPESIQPENNFDVRTNDGDFLTGMKNAFGALFFFKKNSFHVLNGTDPTNFDLTQISDQFGCLSHRAIATYNNILLFLDKKGIAVYNGAWAQIMSDKVEPIFLTMNYAAAIGRAWMVHNKPKNQIWCGIPVNGSTQINKIVVYDYLINAWTHFDGLNVNSANMAFDGQPVPNLYAGSYSGILWYYGSSLTNDMGTGFTYLAQSRFIAELGQSSEKMFRRLYINQESALGATVTWNVAFFQDYSNTAGLTFIQAGMTFQTRSDYGLPAKAMSVQFQNVSSTDIVKLHGFTIESRYLRSV